MADEWDQFPDAPALQQAATPDADPWAQFPDVASDAPQSPTEQPSIVERGLNLWKEAQGATVEPLLALGSSALAAPAAGLAGIAGTLVPGEQGQGARWTEATQQALTYQPRTKAGGAVTEVISYPFEKLAQVADTAGGAAAEVTGSPAVGAGINTAIQSAPALLFRGRGGKVTKDPAPKRIEPTISEPPAVSRAKDYVARNTGLDWNALSDSVRARLAQIASDAKALERLDPAAIERQARLESLPVPIQATRGQLTRDPVALTNEGNLAATETGAQIRAIRDAQSRDLLANIDVLKDQARGRGAMRGAAETPEDVGISVQSVLRDRLRQSQQQVSDLYKRAEAAGELQAPVSPLPLVELVRATPDKSHLRWVQSWLNDYTKRERADGIDVETIRPISLKQVEDLRQAAVARAMDGGTEGYYAGKVIRAIDEATEGAGGDAYKVARAARRQQALDFEDPVAVARLVENKSRTDRATALEDTWRKTVLGGSLADLNQVKGRLLLDDKDGAGRRAWRDMRAETIEYIRNESTRGSQMLPDGTRPVSAAGMERALRAIGPEKLDAIFGARTASRLREIMEVTRLTRTEPQRIHPGSSTMGNALAFLERSLLDRVPFGSALKGAKETAAQRQRVREAQTTPMAEGLLESARTERAARRGAQANRFISLAPSATIAGETTRNRFSRLAGDK